MPPNVLRRSYLVQKVDGREISVKGVGESSVSGSTHNTTLSGSLLAADVDIVGVSKLDLLQFLRVSVSTVDVTNGTWSIKNAL